MTTSSLNLLTEFINSPLNTARYSTRMTMGRFFDMHRVPPFYFPKDVLHEFIDILKEIDRQNPEKKRCLVANPDVNISSLLFFLKRNTDPQKPKKLISLLVFNAAKKFLEKHQHSPWHEFMVWRQIRMTIKLSGSSDYEARAIAAENAAFEKLENLRAQLTAFRKSHASSLAEILANISEDISVSQAQRKHAVLTAAFYHIDEDSMLNGLFNANKHKEVKLAFVSQLDTVLWEDVLKFINVSKAAFTMPSETFTIDPDEEVQIVKIGEKKLIEPRNLDDALKAWLYLVNMPTQGEMVRVTEKQRKKTANDLAKTFVPTLLSPIPSEQGTPIVETPPPAPDFNQTKLGEVSANLFPQTEPQNLQGEQERKQETDNNSVVDVVEEEYENEENFSELGGDNVPQSTEEYVAQYHYSNSHFAINFLALLQKYVTSKEKHDIDNLVKLILEWIECARSKKLNIPQITTLEILHDFLKQEKMIFNEEIYEAMTSVLQYVSFFPVSKGMNLQFHFDASAAALSLRKYTIPMPEKILREKAPTSKLSLLQEFIYRDLTSIPNLNFLLEKDVNKVANAMKKCELIYARYYHAQSKMLAKDHSRRRQYAKQVAGLLAEILSRPSDDNFSLDERLFCVHAIKNFMNEDDVAAPNTPFFDAIRYLAITYPFNYFERSHDPDPILILASAGIAENIDKIVRGLWSRVSALPEATELLGSDIKQNLQQKLLLEEAKVFIGQLSVDEFPYDDNVMVPDDTDSVFSSGSRNTLYTQVSYQTDCSTLSTSSISSQKAIQKNRTIDALWELLIAQHVQHSSPLSSRENVLFIFKNFSSTKTSNPDNIVLFHKALQSLSELEPMGVQDIVIAHNKSSFYHKPSVLHKHKPSKAWSGRASCIIRDLKQGKLIPFREYCSYSRAEVAGKLYQYKSYEIDFMMKHLKYLHLENKKLLNNIEQPSLTNGFAQVAEQQFKLQSALIAAIEKTKGSLAKHLDLFEKAKGALDKALIQEYREMFLDHQDQLISDLYPKEPGEQYSFAERVQALWNKVNMQSEVVIKSRP